MKSQNYYEPITITHGNVTIRIHKPVLTEEERKKREACVAVAMSAMAKEMREREDKKHDA